jgi:hypothetical protein
MEGWNTTWLGMQNTTPTEAQKSQDVVNSQEKLITVKEIFLNIGKYMLENYILNLGQLFKIAFKLKIYLWQKLKLKKTQNVSVATLALGSRPRQGGYKVAGQERDLGVTSHAFRSAKSVRA